MIYVLAFITTLPGHREEVLAAYRANTEAVRAERGCIEYIAGADPSEPVATPAEMGPDSFVIIEKWDDFGCLQAHRISPHMVAYAAKVKHLIAERLVHVVSPVAA